MNVNLLNPLSVTYFSLRKCHSKIIKEQKCPEEYMRKVVNAVRIQILGFLVINEIKKECLGRKPMLTEELTSKVVQHNLLIERNFFGLR